MTGDRQTEVIAQQVARYLHAHPDASDTVEGIAKWWLSRQRFDDASELVRHALEMLIADGVVEKRTMANGVTLFRRAKASDRG
jgi:hypothetical protein